MIAVPMYVRIVADGAAISIVVHVIGGAMCEHMVVDISESEFEI